MMPPDFADFLERARLRQTVLSRRCIQHEHTAHIRFRELAVNHAAHLVQLIHQVLLVVQAAGGINNQQIRALCLGGLDAVIDDRRGVSALGVLDNRHTRAFRPDGQLVSRRCTESIRRAEDNPAAMF